MENETLQDAQENETESELELKNEAEDEINNLKDQVLRLVAEGENTRRRHDKLILDTREYAIFNFAKDLIAILDNCTRALEYKPSAADNSEIANVLKGMEMINHELNSVLLKHGIEAISPKPGDDFDYHYHHAIAKENSHEFDNDKIVKIMQPGYKIKDRLLRPALVAVSIKE
jgi:molecular chaperone GrpE